MSVDLKALTDDAAMSERLETYFRALGRQEGLAAATGLIHEPAVFECTLQFRAFHPIVRSLDGVVLDDAGTSSHHVVLCRSGVNESVLYLAHDGMSRIVFGGIDSFLAAARRAFDADGFVEDEQPAPACVLEDQSALRILIDALRAERDYEDVVPALIPSLDLDDPEFLSTLVIGDGIYVAKVVCQEIAVRPAKRLRPIVEMGASHVHWMVRHAAVRARARIAGISDT